MKDKVIITERGWPGHFICAYDCLFRRNTLITYNNIKWVVSTVGAKRYSPVIPPELRGDDLVEQIGYNRYYETMAFESKYDEYDDADVTKEISFNSEWGLFAESWDKLLKKYPLPDATANEMHNKIVEELCEKIKTVSDDNAAG